jgi:hypothetical protein
MMRVDPPMPAEPMSYRTTPFEVEGVIDGVVVRARTVGGGLVMDTLVRERAELLVDLGEVFALPDGPARYVASLSGGGMATLLTVLRAFDHIRSVTADFERLPITVSDGHPVHLR